MKKYLMIGAAALMIGASFTSCSKEKDLYDPAGQAERFLQSYADAFIRIFGQPAATQDWGFGSQAQARATRADGYGVGAYPDANMWTSKGFLAPDPLTHAQKLRAQYYFQMNNIVNPNRPDYGTKDFFIQQVYDGGTDPMAGKSPEKYLAANNQTYIESGEHMDHLTCGPDHTHTNNFNNGTCSTNDHVANRDQTDVNNTAQQHSDEIMLMLNTKTSCFGYANSDASYVRDDRWTLVSAATIDAFCDGDAGFASWLAGKLEAGEVDKKCDDDFHRDFIGFDFDMIPDESCYVGTAYDKDNNIIYDTYNHAAEIDHYVYASAYYRDANEATNSYVYNLDGTFTTYGSNDPKIVIDGKEIPYVDTQTNKYCALGEKANIGIGGEDNMNDYEKFGTYSENGDNDNTLYIKGWNAEHSDWAAINMKFINKLVKAGYLPVQNKGLRRWVKIGGCNDGYFSDWIVTFMPANSGSVPPPPEYLDEPDYRIIAEDLTIADKGNDFDFNDVVFDVYYNQKDDTKAKIKLQAAGGTLPLEIRVGGQSFEVHDQFGVDVKDMVNTGAGPTVTEKPVFEVTINKADLAGDDGIKLWVNKGSNEELNFIQLTAETGHVAAKIKVDHTYQWCGERVDIDNVYSNFEDYVKNPENYAPYAGKPTWWAK